MKSGKAKLLIIRFGSLGDLILMFPLLESLRRAFPEHTIDLVTKKMYAELFRDCRYIDRLITPGGDGFYDLLHLRKNLAGERYGIIVDAHNVIRSNVIYRTLRAPEKIQIKKSQFKKTMMILGKGKSTSPPPTIIDGYNEIAARFGATPSETGPFLSLPEEYERLPSRLISSRGLDRSKLIALAPGAKWKTKQWPLDKYSELAREFIDAGYGIIITGGASEVPLGSLISRTVPSVLDVTGKLSILETAAMLSYCRLLVTNDSAPLHLAEAVGTPVVALYGPTVREFGYYPRLPLSIAIEKPLACRPCSRNGSRPCPLGTVECLESINPGEVIEAVASILQRDKDRSFENGGS